jgi:hypothetical protein
MSQVYNSANFGWKDIKIFTGGRLVIGIRGFKVKTSKDLDSGYGAGDEPHAIREGNKSYSCEIKVTQAEFEAMTKAVQAVNPNGDITDGEWDITIASARAVGDKISTHRAEGVKFSEAEFGMDQGDKDATVSLPGLAKKIRWNV